MNNTKKLARGTYLILVLQMPTFAALTAELTKLSSVASASYHRLFKLFAAQPATLSI